MNESDGLEDVTTHKNSINSLNKQNSENNENHLSIKFKALRRETSVYYHFIELKEDVFTEKGFLDLIKVPGLRVTGAGQFLKNLRIKARLTQKDVAKIFNVTRGQVGHWENDLTTISLQLLVKLSEASGVSKDMIYSLIDQGKLSLKTASLPVKFEKIRDIVQYLTPHKNSANAQITLLKRAKKDLSRIKVILNVKLHFSYRDRNIFSTGLYNYLKTFFRYTKVPKIQPPLTLEVKHWHDNNVNLKRAIIIPCLQSDGYARRPKPNEYSAASFHGRNRVLHNYFVDAIYYEYGILPTSYCLYTVATKMYSTAYSQKMASEIVDEIMKLAGNSKTSPAPGQTIEEYLKEPQPHLNYLFNIPKAEQKIALRIWMSTEGCIGMRKRRVYARRKEYGRQLKNEFVYPTIALGCAHPVLAKQIQQIAKQLSIPLYVKRSKNSWSGISKLINETTTACIEFLKLGGFIKGVKISAQSKYHEGIYKDVLLLGILEFKKRELENSHLKKLPLQQIHYEINKIIENDGYKSANYYINYFS